MIRSFKDKESEKVWAGRRSHRLPSNIQAVVRRKLRMLNSAQRIEDLKVPPNNRLEALTGNRRGQISIRINDQWRVCFEWRDGDAWKVEVVDYH